MVTIFFPSMEGGLARRIIPVEQQHCQACGGGSDKTLFYRLAHILYPRFFFRTKGAFHLPPRRAVPNHHVNIVG